MVPTYTPRSAQNSENLKFITMNQKIYVWI